MTPQLNTAILHATAVCFSYPQRELFHHFTASFPAGVTLLRGGDGRGKSTLLRLLAGALPASSGQLHINGFDLHSQPNQYKAHVFFAEPRTDAFDGITALEYFDLQRSAYAGFSDAVLQVMTDGLGLQTHVRKQLFMLSTGSKRKVFLAAALASGAPVTLLDEPLAALDAPSIGFLLSWLNHDLRTQQRAFIIADYVAPSGLALAQIIELGD